MRYLSRPVEGTIVKKAHRFLAYVSIDGVETKAHIPNSGRLAELMTPGLPALLEKAPEGSGRKTPYSLRSVRYKGGWVCIDSTVPNRLAAATVLDPDSPLYVAGYDTVRPEFAIGKHRFDLLLTGPKKRPSLIEIKSVTLVIDGVARFPDAPTERGRSHLATLAELTDEGYDAQVVFMVQRADAKSFAPNRATDPAFGDALVAAMNGGVTARVALCKVGKRDITVERLIPMEA